MQARLPVRSFQIRTGSWAMNIKVWKKTLEAHPLELSAVWTGKGTQAV